MKPVLDTFLLRRRAMNDGEETRDHLIDDVVVRWRTELRPPPLSFHRKDIVARWAEKILDVELTPWQRDISALIAIHVEEATRPRRTYAEIVAASEQMSSSLVEAGR